VSFGYTQVPPAEFGADALLDSFDAMAATIARLLPPRR
jgi:hypothetical protein